MAIKKQIIALCVTLGLGAGTGGHLYLKEGYSNTVYLDPAGFATVCLGSRTNLEPGTVLTDEECMARLERDLNVALAAVDRCTPDLPNALRAEWTRFTFWAGSGNYCGSTAAKLNNQGLYAEACQQLPRWVYTGDCSPGDKYCTLSPGGHWKYRLPGVVERRAEELQLCLQAL